MTRSSPLPIQPEPAWDVSRIFPPQGQWNEEDYLNLPGNRLVELDQGRIEVLEIPSELHQSLVMFLYEVLVTYVRDHQLGKVLVAPLPVKLWDGKMREPDVMFMHREHYAQRHENYWRGADLVMEVVSPNDRNRDKIFKRQEYARAGIPEYWLVDPSERTVTVLHLPSHSQEYRVDGFYALGEEARSPTLAGFEVGLNALFADLDDGAFNH